MTQCKHEYHLQCILEWSQRSNECPICWQVIIVFKDPSSQELLAAVENERSLRSNIKVCHVYNDPEIIHDAHYLNDSDYDERIMWNFAAASRAHYVTRRGRQRSLGVGPSQICPSSPEFHSSEYESSEAGSPTSSTLSTICDQESAPVVPSDVNVVPDNVSSRDTHVKPRVTIYSQPSPDTPRQKPNESELFTFSESIKSKFSAASSRYKESIFKSTRGLKEKLLAKNSSVKELSKGVHREMSAGIAGVAKMIERLDLAPKRTEISSPDHEVQTTKGKSVISLTIPGKTKESTGDTSSQSHTTGRQVEVSLVQNGN
jgi:E3 ubiquitin-protein ligase RHF